MKYKILIISLAMIMLMNTQKSISENINKTDSSWKKLWYVNAVWYQVFPDRFKNGKSGNDPHKSERYDKNGKLINIKTSDWEKDQPTITCKFGGDLTGIKDEIPYLKSLGINGIWLNPIFSATSNHRYNTSDYRTIDAALGNEGDLKKLIEKAHENGIRIILDGVFNHTGYEFWAFQDIVEKGKKSKYKDWYYIKGYPVRKLYEQNKKKKANYECWWGIGSLPKLNYDNPEVREHIYEITRHWMKCGIDGWRLDVPEEIKCDEFWRAWNKTVKNEKNDAYLSGEIWDSSVKWLEKGDIFDGVMNYYGFRDPVLKYFAGRSYTVTEFDKTLTDRRKLLPHRINCAMQNLLGSHDTSRILSVLHNNDNADSDKEKKGYYKGPVSQEILNRYRVVVFFQMTYVGCPMIYYGDEIGMTGGKDPDCRRPMIWNPGKQDTKILEWYKKLISLRKQHTALRTGEFETVLCDDEKNIYAYRRFDDKESLICFFNYSPQNHVISLKSEKAGYYKDLLKEGIVAHKDDKTLEISLPAYGCGILSNRI